MSLGYQFLTNCLKGIMLLKFDGSLIPFRYTFNTTPFQRRIVTSKLPSGIQRITTLDETLPSALSFILLLFPIIISELQIMAQLSAFIGQAALQSFFPQLSKPTGTYKPEFNGWDSADDMPKYNKAAKNVPKTDWLKEGQKLTAPLTQRTPGPQKQNPAYQKNKQAAGTKNSTDQNTQGNEQYYTKPTPYNQAQLQAKPTKNIQPQYNLPYNGQFQPQINQALHANWNHINYGSPQKGVKPNNSPRGQQKRTQTNAKNTNPSFQRKLTAEEMDAILSS